jgi:signal peptidase II
VILFLDQVLKIYIKTHYYLGEEHVAVFGLNWFRLHFIENEGMAMAGSSEVNGASWP